MMYIISFLLFAAAIFRWITGILLLCGKLKNFIKDNSYRALLGTVSVITGFVFAVIGLILALADEPPLPLVVLCVLGGSLASGLTHFRTEENR